VHVGPLLAEQQRSLALHAFPQRPQFFGSLFKSTHCLLQQVWVAPHPGTQLTPGFATSPSSPVCVPVCGSLLQPGPSANSANSVHAAQNHRLTRRKPIATPTVRGIDRAR